LKNIFYLILFAISCTSNPELTPPCYHDQGILEAITTAISDANKEEVLSQTMKYDQTGKPLLRKQDGKRETLYDYDGNKFTATIITNYLDIGDGNGKQIIQSIDTNNVTKNDQYGRALEMKGADGSKLIFVYDGCDLETQYYYDEFGKETNKYIFHYKNGLLTKSIWFTSGNKTGYETHYFGYKFDSNGKWIERKYKYSSGARFLEKRTLKYYK